MPLHYNVGKAAGYHLTSSISLPLSIVLVTREEFAKTTHSYRATGEKTAICLILSSDLYKC